jgi:hypothetical protein
MARAHDAGKGLLVVVATILEHEERGDILNVWFGERLLLGGKPLGE